MIEQLPLYVSLIFIVTALLSVWLLLKSIDPGRSASLPARLLLVLIPFWFILQGVLGIGDFYHYMDAFPPRVFLFGVFPVLILVAAYFLFFRKALIENLSIKVLTILHVVRIPVEFVLLWLFQAGQVPRQMTFEGWNFDILSGITAPIIYFLSFRNGKINRPLLIVWNLAALGLLANVVIIAFLSFKSPMQRIAFDQPNVAISYFPFIWLPTIVVPVVLFAHLGALWNLLKGQER
ncbi:MAG: hypothetical protein ABI878_10155 [Acidobacteriota bacterium]